MRSPERNLESHDIKQAERMLRALESDHASNEAVQAWVESMRVVTSAAKTDLEEARRLFKEPVGVDVSNLNLNGYYEELTVRILDYIRNALGE